MQALQVLSLTLLSVLAANAQNIRPGKCPQPPVQADFDVDKYLGKWYGIKKIPNSFQKGECSTATYSQKSPGVVGVLNRELRAENIASSTTGYAKPKDSSEPAKLEVTFSEGSPPSPYWVLSSDYEGHSLVYSCTEIDAYIKEFAWIMSRKNTLSEEKLEELQDVLTSNGINIDGMTLTKQNQELCAVMPEWA
ncbi:hypothetical protein UPYG_G00300570 [Umbra pygmaea]|uniref:Apolipoprotein D n=1 Tax=Umbra pygmaea TaxID=75934 RepID=A0ABD0WMQ8_UMBPY